MRREWTKVSFRQKLALVMQKRKSLIKIIIVFDKILAVIKKTFFSHKSQVDGQKIGLEGVEWGGVGQMEGDGMRRSGGGVEKSKVECSRVRKVSIGQCRVEWSGVGQSKVEQIKIKQTRPEQKLVESRREEQTRVERKRVAGRVE